MKSRTKGITTTTQVYIGAQKAKQKKETLERRVTDVIVLLYVGSVTIFSLLCFMTMGLSCLLSLTSASLILSDAHFSLLSL